MFFVQLGAVASLTIGEKARRAATPGIQLGRPGPRRTLRTRRRRWHRRRMEVKLLDRVRGAIHTRHYSQRTEEAYVHWIRRFIVHHGRRHPAEMGEVEVSAFVSALAARGVSASTQNLALSAVLFLYRVVLRQDVGALDLVPRARTPAKVPVVLTPSEVRQVLCELTGVPQLVATLLYRAGLRLQECLSLRIKDLDFERGEITVRRGKGQKDRRVMLPDAVRLRLERHLIDVRRQHQADLAAGLGRVVLPQPVGFAYRSPRCGYASIE